MNRVLVVDDSEVIGKLLQDYLGAHGYEVVLAHSGNEAFQRLKTETPNLILLDVQLPDVQGFEFCRIVRGDPKTRNIPVIIITATATQTAEKVKGLQQGADDYITKPFEMDELLERIRAVLRRRARQDIEPSPTFKPMEKLGSIDDLAPEPTMSVGSATANTLFSPFSFPTNSAIPGVALGFVLIMILALGGSVIQAPALALKLKPILACALGVLYWGLLTSVLVVSCTFMGMGTTWREGARVMSLAMIPILMKLISGFALAASTSLSPFYFTASPALFWKESTFWIRRADFFEIWSVFLVYALVLSRKKSNGGKAFMAMLLVGAAAWALLLGLGKVITI